MIQEWSNQKKNDARKLMPLDRKKSCKRNRELYYKLNCNPLAPPDNGA